MLSIIISWFEANFPNTCGPPVIVYSQWNVYIKITLGTNKMWSLYTGGLYMKVQYHGKYTPETCKCGLYKQVVFIYRWSLEHLWVIGWNKRPMDPDYLVDLYKNGRFFRLYALMRACSLLMADHCVGSRWSRSMDLLLHLRLPSVTGA